MVGFGYPPVTGRLLLGDEVTRALDSTGRFPVTQDQRNTVSGRFRYQLVSRAWAAFGGSYGSGLPTEFSGTPQDGSTLSVNAGSWSSWDSVTYRYQWQRCDNTGASCQPIGGATGSSYTLTSGDVGHQIMVAVTATDLENRATAANAPAVGPVAAPAPPNNVVSPALTGRNSSMARSRTT